MSDELPEQNGFKLGLIMPPVGHVSGMPKLKTMAGFKTWSKQEITDFIKKKEVKGRRKQFPGSKFVINQGQVGSCCAAATTLAFTRTAILNGVSPDDIPKLNHEFLYAQINYGRDQGALLSEGNRVIQETGVCPMNSTHRYNKDIFKQHFGPSDYTEAKKFRANGVYEASTQEELATIVLSGQGAGVVAVHVGNNFMQLDKNGFPGASPSGPGNHAVGVQDVEIIDGELAFDSFNSWGTSFGEDDGYMYLDWNKHLRVTTQNHKFFVLVGVNVKVNDDKAPVLVA